MIVDEAYRKLSIPPNLQEHMLRVGALLSILSENWKGEGIDSESVVAAGLFHDLANILKFDFDTPVLLGEEALKSEEWKQVQKRIKDSYGEDLHQATLLMGKEIGLAEAVLRIIEDMEWERTEIVLKRHDWEVALAIYADMRIGPFGILPLTKRIDDLHRRKPRSDYEELMSLSLTLEKTIQDLTKISLESVTNSDLNQRFDPMRQFTRGTLSRQR